MASYPGTLRAFLTHINTTEVIDASHVNDLQAEVVALETFLGLNPHVSSASTGSSLGAWSSLSRTYASLADRVANAETGHLADTHSQYSRPPSTETFTGQKTFTAGATYFGDGTGTTNGQVWLSTGVTGGQAAVWWREGTASRWALYRNQGFSSLNLFDGLNGRDMVVFNAGATSTAASTAFNSSLSVGGNQTVSGGFQVNGNTTLAATSISNLTLTGALALAAGTGVAASVSAVGDVAGGGTSTSVARADHVHGREAFSATAPALVPGGGASAVGGSLSPARSDHVHGLPTNVASVSSVGDSAIQGVATSVSLSDHKHGREAFALTVVQDTVGTPTPGVAVTVARGDHFHGLAAASPGTSAVGDAIGAGASTSAARADHVHGREAFGTAITNVDAGAAGAGVAVTSTRSDHKHAVSVGGVTSMLTFGMAAANGVATTLSPSDHNHGTPPAPTPASVGALASVGGTVTGGIFVGATGAGRIALQPGGAANSGFVEFYAANGTRQGYIGYTASVATTIDAGTNVYIAAAHQFNGTLNTTGTLSENGNRVYSTANPPPSAAPVVIMPFYVGGSVGTGLRRPEFIATVPMTIRGSRSRSYAGSGTYSVYVNGAGISGASGAFGITQALYSFTSYNINAGDRVAISVDTASTDASDLSITVDVVTR